MLVPTTSDLIVEIFEIFVVDADIFSIFGAERVFVRVVGFLFTLGLRFAKSSYETFLGAGFGFSTFLGFGLGVGSGSGFGSGSGSGGVGSGSGSGSGGSSILVKGLVSGGCSIFGSGSG